MCSIFIFVCYIESNIFYFFSVLVNGHFDDCIIDRLCKLSFNDESENILNNEWDKINSSVSFLEGIFSACFDFVFLSLK